MKIIVSATLLQLYLKELAIVPDDNVEVSVLDGMMWLKQGGNAVSFLITCNRDIGPMWMEAESFISLEKLLRVHGQDFPLVLQFDGSRIWAHFYL